MKSYKFKYKLSSYVLTVVFVAIIVLVNALLSQMSEKVPMKIDLTKEKVYEFSQQTNEIIKNIDKEVEVYALYPENISNEYVEYAKEYLSKYSNLNKKVNVTYIDPYTNPAFAKKYEKTGETIEPGAIIVECEDKVKVVTLDQLYTQSEFTGATSIDMEKKMTMAFSFVTGQSGDSKVCFTEGHEEQPAYNMQKALEGEGYTIDTINIGMDKIDEDVSLIVISSPTKDFTGDEINILDEFMDKGGKLLYLTTPGIPKLEKMDGYLQEWGIIPNYDLVVETNPNHAYGTSSGLAYPAPILVDHEINEKIKEGGLVFIAPLSGSIKISESNVRYTKNTPLLTTTKDSYGKTNLSSDPSKREESDIEGPLNIAVISEMMGEDDAKLGVLSSYYSMEYTGILDEASYANGHISSS